MPILAPETDIYPTDLFDQVERAAEDKCWWAVYTLSRREKDFMRRLVALGVPFYGPLIPKRTKSPGGRVRTAYLPLFTNYVFVYGSDEDRYQAMTTNCVSRTLPVSNGEPLTRELRQFRDLIAMDAALTPEARLEPGRLVRVRSGRFRGLEGTILRREGELRLLVAVNFIQRGASLLLEDFEVEAID